MRSPVLAALLAVCSSLLAVPRIAPAQVQSSQVTAPQADSALKRIDIAVRPLYEGLADFARQTGVAIVAKRSDMGSVAGNAVQGEMTVVEGIRRLLAGTGFTARIAEGATVVVERVGAEPTARELGRVVVRDRGTRSGYGSPPSSAASRLQGPLRDLPQAVSVVGRTLIADQAMQNMADVVRYMPGIAMGQGEGHRDAPVIRGNNSTADFFVDGVRDDAQYLRDLYNVERVEALQGANAMTFGRGGGGGVINRVSKEAAWSPSRSLVLEGGSFNHQRATLDAGGATGARSALRLNAMLERSDRFRDATRVERLGVNPTAALVLGARTVLRLAAERFDDRRTVDRGIPSFAGGPADAPIRTFFGDPTASRSALRMQSATVAVEHIGSVGVTLRNRTHVARYDKWYQNVFPGAVNAAGSEVALSAYSSDILRDNVFNQSEASGSVRVGAVRHLLLAGLELAAQGTNNFRRTGYFGGTATSANVPFAAPTVSLPLEFRQAASDADNRVIVNVASGYVQDQVIVSEHLQAVVGVRVDRFALDFRNHRAADELSRADRMVSPRVGLVLKPAQPLSIYGSISVSHLPGAGDQFGSLTATTKTLEPERFTNRELGAKWDVLPALSLTVAAYRLDRTNTAAPDPADPSRLVQTGRQRSAGVEVGLSGNPAARWQLQGGFAAQHAEIVDRTSAGPAGASVPLVPRRSASLWNRYDVTSRLGLGLGLIRQGATFAAIDNRVTLPAFHRADAALFSSFGNGTRAQLNVENLFNARYFPTSHGNNNILPGAPRTVRISLTTGL